MRWYPGHFHSSRTHIGGCAGCTRETRPRPMLSREDEHGLRLAATASDRAKAAEQERPAFEERLRQLGYAQAAIAHAFSSLSGPGTVADALEALKDQRRQHTPVRESHLIALSFEVTQTRVTVAMESSP